MIYNLEVNSDPLALSYSLLLLLHLLYSEIWDFLLLCHSLIPSGHVLVTHKYDGRHRDAYSHMFADT